MTEQDGYTLGEDYPPRGRRLANFIGSVRRDEDGWLWYGGDIKRKK